MITHYLFYWYLVPSFIVAVIYKTISMRSFRKLVFKVSKATELTNNTIPNIVTFTPGLNLVFSILFIVHAILNTKRECNRRKYLVSLTAIKNRLVELNEYGTECSEYALYKIARSIYLSTYCK